jgi:hypothetical protein
MIIAVITTKDDNNVEITESEYTVVVVTQWTPYVVTKHFFETRKEAVECYEKYNRLRGFCAVIASREDEDNGT